MAANDPIAVIGQSGNVLVMDRRTLLALAGAVPALAATPAEACSVALKSPRSSGLQNEQVRKLFEAWWDRDSVKFKGFFTGRLMADGTRMEPNLAKELLAADPLPTDTFAIFDRYFTEESKLKRITLIVNTVAGMIIACSEADLSTSIKPDCTGMPKLHLFLVKMLGLNPRAITHLATTETVELNKFSIWTDGSA